MQALTCKVILTGAATRADGSLSLRLSTPELAPHEKTAFFEVLNQNLEMFLKPDGERATDLKEIKGEFDSKTPGQRLRSTLFVWWKQQGEPGEFEDFYRRRMETLIESVKQELQPA